MFACAKILIIHIITYLLFDILLALMKIRLYQCSLFMTVRHIFEISEDDHL
jgi:hypothetical protein